MNWKLLCAIAALFSVYFPSALWLKATYVPHPDLSKVHWVPFPPFPHIGDPNGHAYVARIHEYDDLADDLDHLDRSPLLLFEDGKPLGPPHSKHEDISKLGQGRYSHWKGIGLIFSPSDNGDPNAPWRKYSVEPYRKRFEEPRVKGDVPE